jgi:hypothetical protein
MFTNVPVEEVSQVIGNRLNSDPSFLERSPLKVGGAMELLDVCLTTTYLQYEGKFYQQKEGIAMGNSPSPAVSNIFMEHFEEIALDSADHRPAKWIRYVDDTFVVWPYGPARLQQFLRHLNSLRPAMKFTMEVEINNTLPSLDVLAMKRAPNLAMKVYRKPTHTGRFLYLKSNHPHHVKIGVLFSFTYERCIKETKFCRVTLVPSSGKEVSASSFLLLSLGTSATNMNDTDDDIKNIRFGKRH